MDAPEWDQQETEAIRAVMDLYGKTWHFWQVDRGDELPLGTPVLMGSLTQGGQVDLKEMLKERDAEFGVSHEKKMQMRKDAGLANEGGEVAENADSWWKKAKANQKV